ncbi:ArdK [Pectobacterium atrosepticum ICMP 1526]|uniref:TrfB-related DNA-binding protein n=1 Tax=Pectobacterium atrosepticum TaxID=29471 RepID=UPI0005020FD0|nr:MULTISPECIES: TrfB-related DNA-binding protein [Pectobacterium]KFX10884.1 hypothetical protein JV34_22225 [Pectobacterium atrosepticum]KMK87554.1 ArdK [Pectobacterium atrosepticum ICMP 1526]MCL6336388.1 ArdK family transcriptional regulator [Pectobacterium carotovorum subsp. carotovorum]QXE13039.1 ArdK family transcriptional regulator [Pectobacterium atrosepticum]
MARERISSEEWARLLPALSKCAKVTIEMAHEILVEGRRQVDVAEKYGRTKTTVNAAKRRVLELCEEVISAPDLEFVEVWLPREEAQRVLQMASKYAVNKK